ncbi:hypothetical protein JW887_05240 [Candidatus Dojkabacteria bacterium]|nr:hypothetical protein [Candidatus Dojkabacteria bacterium]
MVNNKLEFNIVLDLDLNTYSSGYPVNITLTNNLNSSIWYAKHVNCGMSCFEIETCDGHVVRYSAPCDWFLASHDFTELKPGCNFSVYWDGKVMNKDASASVWANPGCYRIFIPYVKEDRRAIGEGWGENVERVYSRKFKIV